jgi:hypothetical protein
VSSCTDRSASLFFVFETRGSQIAIGYVAALEPAPVGRRGPETHDMWQRRSTPQTGGEV